MRHSSSFGRSHIANRTISIILDGPLVLAVNYLWLKKADHVLEHIDELSFHMLAFVEGEDSFNVILLHISISFFFVRVDLSIRAAFGVFTYCTVH